VLGMSTCTHGVFMGSTAGLLGILVSYAVIILNTFYLIVSGRYYSYI